MKKTIIVIILIMIIISTVVVLEKLINKKEFDTESVASAEISQSNSAEIEDKIKQGYTIIYTQTDLRNISSNISGKYYLANDINFNGEVFSFQNNFTGEFDGNGHSIKNIKITTDNMNTISSFSLFAENMGIIKNLNIENIDIDVENVDYYPTGVIARKNSGTIENCIVSGFIKVSGSNASAYGICGNLTNGVIKNCTNKGNITAKYGASGIVTYSNGNIENCTNEGNITSENSSATGIVITNTGTIKNCKNTGNITGANCVAGITTTNGDPNEKYGSIIDCYSSGTITLNEAKEYQSNKIYVGGIVGNHILGEIKNTTFEGNIKISTQTNVNKGNIAGAKSNRATIDVNNSYGQEYDFQEYYDENWMATLDD